MGGHRAASTAPHLRDGPLGSPVPPRPAPDQHVDQGRSDLAEGPGANPPQVVDKFNPGQKLNATFTGAAIVVMLVTGVMLK